MARPAMSAATSLTSGAAIRQGPHHAAQISTRTGTRASEGGMKIGITPQHKERKSKAASFGVGARIGCFGRNRATRQAVEPDHVGVMIAAAPISFAMK